MAFQTPDCVATAGGDLPGSCSMVSLYPLGDAFPSRICIPSPGRRRSESWKSCV